MNRAYIPADNITFLFILTFVNILYLIGTGDLSGPWATKDSANLISYIKGLDANGGGDCPEMAMSGTEVSY